MADVYVYRFVPFRDAGLSNPPSLRAATLSVISGIGEPIMDSQLVVDSSELDADGFLTSGAGFCSSEITALTAMIRSLELRAESRDREAQSTVVNDRDLYMLKLESRHLRAEARKLTIDRANLLAEEAGHISTIRAVTTTI